MVVYAMPGFRWALFSGVAAVVAGVAGWFVGRARRLGSWRKALRSVFWFSAEDVEEFGEALCFLWAAGWFVWLDVVTLVSVDAADWGVEALWKGMEREEDGDTVPWSLAVLSGFLQSGGYGEVSMAVVSWVMGVSVGR